MSKSLRTRALAYATLMLASVVFLAPVAWMILQSLKRQIDTIAFPPKFVFTPTLQNYASVLATPGFRHALAGSLVAGFGSVAIAMAVGVPFAYAIARFRFPGRDELGHFILSTKMLPAVVVIVPLEQVFKAAGLLDSYLGVTLSHVLLSLAIVVWVMRGFFQTLPFELEEAAAMDGATPLRGFISIVLPLARPGLATVAVLGFILSWNDFFFALTLTSLNVRTLPAFLGTNYVGYLAVDWGRLSAAGLLATLPVVVLTLAMQRYLVSGLSLGAVR